MLCLNEYSLYVWCVLWDWINVHGKSTCLWQKKQWVLINLGSWQIRLSLLSFPNIGMWKQHNCNPMLTLKFWTAIKTTRTKTGSHTCPQKMREVGTKTIKLTQQKEDHLSKTGRDLFQTPRRECANLGRLRFVSDRIFLTIYRQTRWWKFPCGTMSGALGAVTSPSSFGFEGEACLIGTGNGKSSLLRRTRRPCTRREVSKNTWVPNYKLPRRIYIE